ncbi:MAG TPA: permease [Fibrobacteres bacterium]|nr:permease [Fibrobacterota bacterium]
MKVIFLRYVAVIVTALLFVGFLFIFPHFQNKATEILLFQAETMLLVIPPVFILLGLLDVWVPREKMMRFMGPESGAKGVILAFLFGSFAAGPLYGAFPVAAVLMKKGAGFMNILIFIGAWSTTKIPMLLFESSALGIRFTLSRLAIDIVGIAIIAGAIKTVVPQDEVERLYEKARTSF